MSSNNPYEEYDRVEVKRGDGWLAGTVTKIVLARCHVMLDDSMMTVVDDYHDIRRERECGHSACSQNYIDTGETACVVDGGTP